MSKRKLTAATLAASALFGASQMAKADSLLLPYFSTAGGNDTVINIIDVSGNGVNISYMYKDLTDNPADCTHFDVDLPLTPEDITSILASTGDALFGDAPGTVGIGLGFEGYAVIIDGDLTVDFETSGDAIVVNFATGTFVEQPLLRLGCMDICLSGFDSTASAEPIMNNSNVAGLSVGVTAELQTPFTVPVYPFDTAVTLIYAITNDPISLAFPPRTTATITHVGGIVWDRDEVRVSTSGEKVFTCAAMITMDELLGAPELAFMSANGGWMWLTPFSPPPAGQTDEVMTWKIEVSVIPGFPAVTMLPNRTYTPSVVY